MLDESLFVSEQLHERTVTLADGTKHVLHFKEVPAVVFRAFHQAEQSGDEEVRAGSVAKIIAASLCDPDGKPAITYERARQLKAQPMNAIFAEILSINGLAAKEKNA